MTEEQFTALLTQLGYPEEKCPRCFRYINIHYILTILTTHCTHHRALTSAPDADRMTLKELVVSIAEVYSINAELEYSMLCVFHALPV